MNIKKAHEKVDFMRGTSVYNIVHYCKIFYKIY